jgi:hypothetical protein
VKILFILAMWIYFVFEGVTEGMATSGKQFEDKAYQNRYHIFRLLENFGVILGVHVLIFAGKTWEMLPIFWLSVGSGLGLYEMAFSWIKYKNPLHNKTSHWLGIHHPPGWVSLLAFVLFAATKVLVLT